jgi:hypothetical protein
MVKWFPGQAGWHKESGFDIQLLDLQNLFLRDCLTFCLEVPADSVTVFQIGLERWLSGLKRRFAKPVKEQSFRGFESLSLRHLTSGQYFEDSLTVPVM